MVDINSDNYYDFVIKNGKLIGEFEQMYRKSKEVPWHQYNLKSKLDVKLAVDLVKEHSPFDYICDFGCGLGYLLDILKKNVAARKCRLVGYDVSPTCLKKAKKMFPGIAFCKLDLTKTNKHIRKEKKSGEKRLFVIRGTLWYVCPHMKNVVKNIAKKAGKNDFLLVCQNFPPLESNFFGKNIIPDPGAIVDWFSGYFRPIMTLWLEDKVKRRNDNWFYGLFLRKQ